MEWCILFFVSAALFGVLHAQSVLLGNTMTAEDKKIVVDYHNELRKMVTDCKVSGQPKATDMLILKWHDLLGDMSQTWANGMNTGHNPNRTLLGYSIGENIFASSDHTNLTNTFNWKSAIDTWYNEYKTYTFDRFRMGISGEPMFGHYTQVVWSTTEYIGCGNSYFKSIDNKYIKLYVCNYGTAGNIIGMYPYKNSTCTQ